MATETFPTKPKLKPTSNKTTPTPESKYWKSFKTPKDFQLNPTQSNFRISSLSFSPTSPHDFATCHSATLSIYSNKSFSLLTNITSFHDSTTSSSFRCDGKLLACSDQTGSIHIFDPKAKNKRLRVLKGHNGPAQVVSYPKINDKFHLFSGGDDSVVKYWDVATEKCVFDLFGSKDYVRCGDTCPVSDDMFVSGGYDHKLRVWDVRVKNRGGVLEMDCEKPVESVVYLPSGGLVATGCGNFVKVWDVIGGGRLLYSMESHNKTVTGVCLGKIGEENRVLSVGLDGFFKVFDYGRFKVTHSMRFPKALMSVGFSPDCGTRVIGGTNGSLYVGRRKTKGEEEVSGGLGLLGFGGFEEEARTEVLRPTYFRYFHRGQNVKPSEGDYLVKKQKKVKMASYDKLLMKFRHKEAFADVLSGKNPENVVAVIEELVARKKLMRSVANLDVEELGLLLGFLQKYLTMPRFGGLLTRFLNKVIELRADDIKGSDVLRGHIRNIKRGVEEEIRIKQSLLEIQGIISPMMRIAARR